MGFRNPARSAIAVDTGAGAIPGVKVYSDGGNPGMGVVEWDTYLSRVLALLSSSESSAGGSVYSIQLNDPHMNPGPSLTLAIEELAAGGYGPAIRVSHPMQPVESFHGHDAGSGFYLGTWRDYVTGGHAVPTIYKDAAGWVHIEGLATNGTGSVVANAGANIMRLTSPDYWPPERRMFATLMNNALARVDVTPDGFLNLVVNPAQAASGFLNLDFHYYAG